MGKIFVSNLSYKSTNDSLKTHFEQYGEVLSAKVINDKDTGNSRGFGFVEMVDINKALNEGNQSSLEGRMLKVVIATERAKTPKNLIKNSEKK